jgi:SulP family sulfate permease
MRFPEGIPATLPQFDFPAIPFERTRELLPAAFTIAFLAGVESLLSAVVADGMTGGRHRSNMELIAQGVANCGSALFGGLPATGAIARTATNIRAGARSPVAGILHAAFLLAFMLLLAPLMAWVPLPALAAVLLLVAWNMAEIEHIRHLMRGPYGDRLVLVVTFALTVAVDLTIAIEVGVVLGALVFMHRMAEVTAVGGGELEDDRAAAADDTQRADLPAGVEVYRFQGPLFFAVASRLDTVLEQYFQQPRVLILRMRLVPMVDASGATALRQFLDRAHRLGIRVVLSGLAGAAREVCAAMHVLDHPAVAGDVAGYDDAVPAARALLEKT